MVMGPNESRRVARARAGLGPAVGRANGKDEVLGALIAAGGEPLGEFGGGQGFAAAVEQDGDCRLTGMLAV